MSFTEEMLHDRTPPHPRAPHVTAAQIENSIVAELYFTPDWLYSHGESIVAEGVTADRVSACLKLLTLCVLVLRNGFTVTGESACAAPENFDSVMGRKLARQKAIDKVWMLEGYLLKERLSLGVPKDVLNDIASGVVGRGD